MTRGRLITFEGGEGAGKSTQARRLVERLRAMGLDALQTREPGGSPHAERIREVLLSGEAERFGPVGEAILFAAARIDHVDRLIRPALAQGRTVVCDRYVDSTRVYQGALGDVPRGLIAALERVAVGPATPDLTILIDLDPRIGLARAAARRGAGKADRFETEDLPFHHALRRAFLAIAEAEPRRVLVVDGELSQQALGEAIWAGVRERLALRGAA